MTTEPVSCASRLLVRKSEDGGLGAKPSEKAKGLRGCTPSQRWFPTKSHYHVVFMLFNIYTSSSDTLDGPPGADRGGVELNRKIRFRKVSYDQQTFSTIHNCHKSTSRHSVDVLSIPIVS